MSDLRTPLTTHVAINGSDFVLTPGQDLVELMSRLEGAARSAGSFVHFTTGMALTGVVFMSVFVTAASRIVISVQGETAEEPIHEPALVGADWDY